MTDIYRIDLAAGQVEEATPEEAARLREVAAVDGIVADFAGTDDGRHDAVELTEGEPPAEPVGRYFGTEEFMRMASESDAPPSEDQDLHDALRAEADGFGDDDGDATDEELWEAVRDSWGLDEEGQR